MDELFFGNGKIGAALSKLYKNMFMNPAIIFRTRVIVKVINEL